MNSDEEDGQEGFTAAIQDDGLYYEPYDGRDSIESEQLRLSACKSVASEMQHLLQVFATDQRARMDTHLCQLERLLSELPNKLQSGGSYSRMCSGGLEKSSLLEKGSLVEKGSLMEKGSLVEKGSLMDSPRGEHVDRGLLLEPGDPLERGSQAPKHRLNLASLHVPLDVKSSMPLSLASSAASAESTDNPRMLPRAASSLTVKQEYVQMKTHVFSESRSQRAMSWMKRQCPLPRAKPHHVLPVRRLRNFVHGTVFGNMSLGIIFVNLIFTVMVSDIELRGHTNTDPGHVPTELPRWFHLTDFVFLGLFTVELLLRLFVEEAFFFVGEHWKWNLLDLVVVVSTAIDTLSFFTGPTLSFVRIIRLLRVVRSMKVLRIVRYCDELRVMMLQIMNSLRPMVWAFVFLALVILMFALAFTQGVISYFEEYHAARIMLTEEGAELGSLFRSFPMSLLALFMSISGGINWWSVVKPLLQVSPIYVTIYFCYILVLMIGVLNIIVGIFADNATSIAAKDREALAHEELEKNIVLMKGLEDIFEELDEVLHGDDKSGVITWKDFEELTKKSEVRALFATLELDVSHTRDVFQQIDVDGNECLTVDEFVVGIMRAKGLAKRTDIHGLMYDTEKLLKSLRKHQRWTAQRFKRIEAHFASISKDDDNVFTV